MHDNQILLVDDEKGMRDILSKILRKEGYEVLTASDGREAVDKIKNCHPVLTFLDLRMPGMGGMETLSQIKNLDDESKIIILTGYGSIDSTVTAIKLGAYDYITKPFNNKKIKILIQNALKSDSSIRKFNHSQNPFEGRCRFENIIGASRKMQVVYDLIEKASSTDITVFLGGESGTGKELVAQAIHHYSLRKNNPFVAIDVASFPGTLMESELFGYEKGSFTGAETKKLGKFELAQRGTIFLDEIGNLTPEQQVKLLRVLEEREIERLGGKEKIAIDIRLIAATNIDLGQAVKRGTFREDLYYRINVFNIQLPHLRERKEDIPLLIEYFLKKSREKYKKNIKKVSSKVINTFMNYNWPGNVRELKNSIESAVLLSDDVIKVKDLPAHFRMFEDIQEENHNSLKKNTRQAEKKTIIQALEENNWNKSKTAKSLKIDYKTLYNKIKQYQINPVIDE